MSNKECRYFACEASKGCMLEDYLKTDPDIGDERGEAWAAYKELANCPNRNTLAERYEELLERSRQRYIQLTGHE